MSFFTDRGIHVVIFVLCCLKGIRNLCKTQYCEKIVDCDFEHIVQSCTHGNGQLINTNAIGLKSECYCIT